MILKSRNTVLQQIINSDAKLGKNVNSLNIGFKRETESFGILFHPVNIHDLQCD